MGKVVQAGCGFGGDAHSLYYYRTPTARRNRRASPGWVSYFSAVGALATVALAGRLPCFVFFCKSWSGVSRYDDCRFSCFRVNLDLAFLLGLRFLVAGVLCCSRVRVWMAVPGPLGSWARFCPQTGRHFALLWLTVSAAGIALQAVVPCLFRRRLQDRRDRAGERLGV